MVVVWKIVLTIVVLGVWILFQLMNVAGAGRTVTQMQELGIGARQAYRRTMQLVFLWMAVTTVLALVALVVIW